MTPWRSYRFTRSLKSILTLEGKKRDWTSKQACFVLRKSKWRISVFTLWSYMTWSEFHKIRPLLISSVLSTTGGSDAETAKSRAVISNNNCLWLWLLKLCFDTKTLFVLLVPLLKAALIRQTDKQGPLPPTLHKPDIIDRSARITTCLSKERQ